MKKYQIIKIAKSNLVGTLEQYSQQGWDLVTILSQGTRDYPAVPEKQKDGSFKHIAQPSEPEYELLMVKEIFNPFYHQAKNFSSALSKDQIKEQFEESIKKLDEVIDSANTIRPEDWGAAHH